MSAEGGVFDEPAPYPEFSATAMIATAILIGIRNGWFSVSRTNRLCYNFRWRVQVGSARGVAIEPGPLKDTQGKPEVGPYAPKK